MSVRSIIWSAFADQCLDEIHHYIEVESGSVNVVNKFILKILAEVSSLANFPDAGEREQLLKSIGQNSRYIVVGNYKIIYQYTEKQIIITDVFHTKQNPQKVRKRQGRK